MDGVLLFSHHICDSALPGQIKRHRTISPLTRADHAKMQRISSRIVLISLLIHHVRAPWPSSDKSQVQLLGLFMDDLNSPLSSQMMIHCQAMFKAAISHAETLGITIDGQPIGWQLAETRDDVISTLEYTCLVVSNMNVVGIVGPRLSREAHVISKFGQRIGVPVVSYSATDPDLSDRRVHPAFYRTIPSDASAAKAVAKLFKRYNWTSCILIYQNDAFGSSGVKVIGEAFAVSGMTIAETIVFDVARQAIQGNLAQRMMNSATRVVVLWTDSTITETIIQEAASKNLLGPTFLWILSISVSLDSFNESFNDALIGMLVVEPVPEREIDTPANAPLLSAAFEIWRRHEPESFPADGNVNSYALFAFDATWLLIQALHQLCPPVMNNRPSPCLSFENSTFCFKRQLLNSSALLEQVSATRFVGVSGPIEHGTDGADRIGGIHYITRNARSLGKGVTFVPALKYSEPGEWQLIKSAHDIIWPGKNDGVPVGRAAAAGVKLRIGMIESPPFTMIKYNRHEHDHNVSYRVGYMPDLIELLRKRMEFVLEILMAPLNQTYAGLVDAVANEDLDMVVGDVLTTSTRRKRVAFSATIYDFSLRLLVRKPKVEQVPLFAYLRPFSLSLWMATLATTICTAMLVCLVEREENEALRDRSILSMGAMAVWYSLGNIMGYGADFHVTTISGRILTVALYILSLVLVASYTANLASNLTISKTKHIISSVEDLKQGKVPFNRIGIRVGTSAEDFYLREISEGSRNYHPLKSQQDQFDRLLNGDIDATIIDRPTGEYLTNNVYCQLTLVGSDFDSRKFGIMFPKNWLFIEDFDRNVLAMREQGEFDKLNKRWFKSSICHDALDAPNAMNVESMAGLFLTVGIIVIVALLALVWRKRTVIKNRIRSSIGRPYNINRDQDAATGRPH